MLSLAELRLRFKKKEESGETEKFTKTLSFYFLDPMFVGSGLSYSQSYLRSFST